VTVVAPHQPNLLPGVSVITKLAAADVFIACDEMQYQRFGFTNRNRFGGEQWMSVPVNHEDLFAPINRVRIADPRGAKREKIARTIEQKMGEAGKGFAAELRRPWRLLVGLNMALLHRLFDAFEIKAEIVLQSHLESGRYFGPLTSDSRDDLVSVSERLAAMTAEVGGTVYLSGPSGRNYLDETPFEERGIAVEYWAHDGPNPCALEVLVKTGAPEGAFSMGEGEH
jgi:hypothetical protein